MNQSINQSMTEVIVQQPGYTGSVNYLTHSWFVEISLRHCHALVVEHGAFSPKIDYVSVFFGDFKSQRASKSHHCFKGYSNFGERGDIA